MLASHGFQNVLERANLGRFLLRRLDADPIVEGLSAPVRIRMAFEKLGPTFVKLGQVLASRPDLVPEDFVEEFRRLHESVAPMSTTEVDAVLARHFTDLSAIFQSFEGLPMASASIGQVHKAVLVDGTSVVVKIRRPGLVELIESDMSVLFKMAELLEKYVPELKSFNPIGFTQEFFKALMLETNFVVEANNIRRFQENFKADQTIRIPKVYSEISSDEILVLEAFEGLTLNRLEHQGMSPEEADQIVNIGLRAFFKMVFKDRYFHGDLHAGNLFILKPSVKGLNNDTSSSAISRLQLGLIDFGVVGRLSPQMCSSISDILMSLAKEDYEALADTYAEIGTLDTDVDLNLLARDLRDLISPYYGLSFQNVNSGKMLMESTRIAAQHGLKIPSELMLFFKSIVTVEGMGRLITKDFDVLSYGLIFAKDIALSKLDPQKIAKDLGVVGKDTLSLLMGFPRQLKLILRRLGQREHAWKMKIEGLDQIESRIHRSFNLLFLGLLIGSFVVGASLIFSAYLPVIYHLNQNPVPTEAAITSIFGVPALVAIFLSLASALGVLAFINYFRD